MKKKLFLVSALSILALTSCTGTGDVIKGKKMSIDDALSYCETNFKDIENVEKEGTFTCTTGNLTFSTSGLSTTLDKSYFPDISIDENDNIIACLETLKSEKELEEDYIEAPFLNHEVYLNGSSFTVKSYITAEEYKDAIKESMEETSSIKVNEFKGDGIFSYYYYDENGYISGKKITYDVYVSLTIDLSDIFGKDTQNTSITFTTSLSGEVIYSASWSK